MVFLFRNLMSEEQKESFRENSRPKSLLSLSSHIHVLQDAN
jgi:hypothetical protein